ncbi:NADPH-dependent FMN reductase [Gloeobacter violaceus]|uniref:NADH-dependent FMN reductase n=1 Tax=Gloeobacter violaceus (strain ATCC 29082 / PCC 7421) TaxID=251221 RepID=Q7NGX2_GLOVI|nr:NADPH-dependent FMN reductase [Gloeobacter violaceus]BAC90706.1 NADH-dependent FMN reductase [Gloeobacter violaceus PCC 7421]
MARILAVSGSPSHPSRTHSLVEYAVGLLPPEVGADVFAVRDLPPEVLVFARFDSPALDGPKALLEKADGLIIATPIYKAAYTGLLKSFLDLLPQKALLGKAVLPIATGGTIAHLLAIDYALKPVLCELGARHLLGGVYAVDKQIQRQADGSTVLDEEIDQRLKHSVGDLVKAIGG